ncbi:hypothetical protein Vretimale_13640 [Volvox reticuliferus]|uniref:Uncharacterized protein n=1 Tax=Volvox reticuliferus TaxID=1737510 RepID=A0A8J4LUA0_9CHLO|nr:hypothetical protein Vretifemale_478 [Volvox reticuliferus]GIM09829.1 hypothetical protein Vretimale_13640 [Volvox reticuliferus]
MTKRKAGSPVQNQNYTSAAQARDQQVLEAQKNMAAKSGGGSSSNGGRVGRCPFDRLGSSDMREMEDRIIKAVCDRHRSEVAELKDIIALLKQHIQDLEQRVTMQQQGGKTASTTLPKRLHEDCLLLEVPEEKVPQAAELIGEALQITHPGTKVNYDIIPRRPWQAPSGGTAPNTSPTNMLGWQPKTRASYRLVDVYMAPGCRKTLASTGGELYRRYGIAVRDTLTRAGVELHQQRYSTFARLIEEQKRSRWENGADIRYLNDAGVRVPWVNWTDGGNASGRGGGGTNPGATAGATATLGRTTTV